MNIRHVFHPHSTLMALPEIMVKRFSKFVNTALSACRDFYCAAKDEPVSNALIQPHEATRIRPSPTSTYPSNSSQSGRLHQFRSQNLNAWIRQPWAPARRGLLRTSSRTIGTLMKRILNTLRKHPPAHAGQIRNILLDGSHTPTKSESLQNIVVTDHPHIVCSGQTTFRQSLAKTERHNIIAAEHGRGTTVNNPIRRIVTALKTIIAFNAQSRIERHPGLFERIHESIATLRRARLRNISRNQSDALAPVLQQILRGQTATKIIIETDSITPAALRQTVYKHHRARGGLHVGLQSCSNAIGAGFSRGNEHDAIHSARC